MRELIILLLCCGVLVSMVGCGGNTAPPPTEIPPTTVSEMIMTKTPPTMKVEPTEKEKEPISNESNDQAAKPTTTMPTATAVPKHETTKVTVTNTSEEMLAPRYEEIITSTTSQHTESETTVIEPTKETVPESETPQSEFDIQYWISFAKESAVSIGLLLDSAAINCWDNPIRAGAHCIYLERDIKNRLNRYAKDEDITDVWIWAEHSGNDCYDIYVGYA